jgi:hypothetical protein
MITARFAVAVANLMHAMLSLMKLLTAPVRFAAPD